MLNSGYRQTTSTLIFAAVLAASALADMSSYHKAWNNPKILAWKEYPFLEKPGNTLHDELWHDFTDLPEEFQRGRLIYKHSSDARNDFSEANLEKLRRQGWSLIHIHTPLLDPECVKAVKKTGFNIVPRLDAKHFFGNYDIWRISEVRSGISSATGFVPNHDWFRKFPPSLAANAVMRDGQLAFEYASHPCTQRRTCNFMHPISLQIRDAFLREGLLGEQVFDLPLEPEKSGCFGGVWFDNPNNQVPSYDPYSREYTAREFRKRFADKYPGEKNELWYSDPPYFYVRHHDQEVMEWWENLWAEAHAQYYAWQYRHVNRKIGPKLGKKHMFVGGNFKLCQDRAAWDYYAFSRDIADCMGPGESSHYYSDKFAVGYKMALAASNGKPGGLWHGSELDACEGIACLGVINHLPDHLVKFLFMNRDLFHNAKPGADLAFLYHLEDGLHHNEVANMCRLTDQIWQAGLPLEIITERHLSMNVLRAFRTIVVPGFKFTERDVDGLKVFLKNGGNLLLVGDNRAPDGSPLLCSLVPGASPWKSGNHNAGKGRIVYFASQLLTQSQMTEALDVLHSNNGFRLDGAGGKSILVNVITQPEKDLAVVNLVNFSGEPLKGLTVHIPESIDVKQVALISPYGNETILEVKDHSIAIPDFSLYVALVVSSDGKMLDGVVARNLKAEFKPFAEKLPTNSRLRGPNKTQLEPDMMESGQKLCHLRQTGRCDLHRVEADIVTAARGKVGTPHPVRLLIHRVGVHVPDFVEIDKLQFVAVNLNDDTRCVIPVEMKPDAGKETETVPAGTFVRKDSTVTWTPEKAGRYQLYLSYRYVSEAFEGKPDHADAHKWRKTRKNDDLDEYFWSVPLLKLVYEDRLPCLTVDVQP